MVGDVAPGTAVQVKRSARRRRTVAAYRDGDTVIVLIPARFTAAEEREWVQKMVARLDSRERRSRRRGDADLEARARHLARRYFDDRVRPVSVRWVTNQRGRWGSCTPADGSVRLSDRLRSLPSWVIDYVLVHELAHLRVPGHGPDFWALVERYPRAQRARGFLEGVAAAAGIAFATDKDLGGLTAENPADVLDESDAVDDPDASDHHPSDSHDFTDVVDARNLNARDLNARDLNARDLSARDLEDTDVDDDLDSAGRAG